MKQYAPSMQLAKPVNEKDHIIGPESAQITILEYGDYDCSLTKKAYAIINEVLHKLKGKVRLVYRHFPLMSEHPNAEFAAEVVEAAAAQGKFWEMHKFLFEEQHNFDLNIITEFAEDIGLDVEQFEKAIAERYYKDFVHEDIESGIASGVGSTPTFFINGILYSGPIEHDPIIASIEAAAHDAEENYEK